MGVVGSFTFGPGGWVCHTDKEGRRVLVRFEASDGFAHIVEMYLPPQDGLSRGAGDFAGGLPIQAIERALSNSPGYVAELEKCGGHRGIPLEVLASHFQMHWTSDRTTPADPPLNWVRDAYLTSLPIGENVRIPEFKVSDRSRSSNPDRKRRLPTVRPWVTGRSHVDEGSYPGVTTTPRIAAAAWPTYEVQESTPSGEQLRDYLKLPHKQPTDKTPYGREYWDAVAERYRYLLLLGVEDPAERIASANGISPRTVHDWIRKCRQCGSLGPAQRRGRVGEQPTSTR